MSEQLQPDRVVLVALDGSPAAATALPVACAIGAQLGARVEALHVAGAGASVAEVERVAESAGVELRRTYGDPADEILRAGEAEEVTLVVLATHGHELHHRRGALASIPRRVAARTSRPLLLVRPEATTRGRGPRPIRNLLFPVDGTPQTAAACAPAADLAARLAAEIDVLFVVHPHQVPSAERGTILPPYYVDQPQYEWPAWRKRVTRWMRCYCASLSRSTVIRAHVATGRSHDEIGHVIARFAGERFQDAIILVRRGPVGDMEQGRSPILRVVLERAPCPVLLIAGPARERQDDPPNISGAGEERLLSVSSSGVRSGG